MGAVLALQKYVPSQRLSLSGVDVPVAVLLAEDDLELRRMLALALRNDGYRVIEARDGVQVLDRLGIASLPEDDVEVEVDVIVSDVRMPGVTGIEVLNGLRSFGIATPVILITAFPDDDVRLIAAELDAMLLDKPVSPSQLRDAVRRRLNPAPRAERLSSYPDG